MSKLQSTLSTLSYIDQMSLHIQDDRKIEQQILFIHLCKTIPTHHISILKTKIQHKYRSNYQLTYYQTYKDILTLSLKNQPVCIIFVSFEDRSWAKKFCSNQQLSERFRMYIVSTTEEDYTRASKYNTQHLRTILLPNDIDDISTQICLLSQKSIRTDSSKIIYPTYFQNYSTSKLLTIFISSSLVCGFEAQGKKILKNKQHQNVEIRQFKNIEQFLQKLRNDISVRKKLKMQVDQLIIEECSNKKLTQQEQINLWRIKELELRNIIFIQKRNPDIEVLKQFIFQDDYRRWEIISIHESESMYERFPNHYADYPFPQQHVPELNQIIESQELYIIIPNKEIDTINQIISMNKMNCNNKLLSFSSSKQLGQILTNVQLKQNSYGILVISSSMYKQFRSIIRSYIDSQFPILNLKILLTEPLKVSHSILSSQSSIILKQQRGSSNNQCQYWLNSNFINNSYSKPLLQFIIEERCTYFYPAFGLEQRKIVLLVNHQQSQMVYIAQQIIKKNQRRISVEYWNGIQHVKYILSKLKQDEWGLVFIQENQLKNTVDIMTTQSQLIVVGKNYKKYSHHKILKQGTQQQILQFFNLIPAEQPTSSALNTTSSVFYNDSELEIQTLKRFDFDENSFADKESQHNIISVRLPLNIEIQNLSLLETRLIQKLKQKVVIKYYGTTGEIRDMGNRWEQKTQYLVITDDYLEWTQQFAKMQQKQRFEILLYTYQNVNNFDRLVTKSNCSRFKLVTNRWSEIQSYITRSNELCLQGQQKLEVVLGESDRKLQTFFQNSNLLSRTFFKYYDENKQFSIKQVIKQISPKNLIFVVLNENNSTTINQQRVIDDIVKFNPSARTILISPTRKSSKPRTIVSFGTLQEMEMWIKKIKVRGSFYAATGAVKVDRLR